MTADEIQRAIADITAESDPTLKHLKLASLVSVGFRERGIELVVVGGSAIEFYTEGAYVSGDLDLCVAIASTTLTVRLRQEIMARFGARGGPRSWQVAGAFVDVLASFENSARTPLRIMRAPYGEIRVAPVEELIVERILVFVTILRSIRLPVNAPENYWRRHSKAKSKRIGRKIRRLAQSSAYDNWSEVKELIHEQAQALQVRDPCDSDE